MPTPDRRFNVRTLLRNYGEYGKKVGLFNDQHIARAIEPPPSCLRRIGQCKFDCQVVIGYPIMLGGGLNLKGLAYEGFDGRAVP